MSGSVGREAPWSRHAAGERLLWVAAAGAAVATALQVAVSPALPTASTPGIYRASLPGGLLLISIMLTSFGCLPTILLAMKLLAERESECTPPDCEHNGGAA